MGRQLAQLGAKPQARQLGAIPHPKQASTIADAMQFHTVSLAKHPVALPDTTNLGPTSQARQLGTATPATQHDMLSPATQPGTVFQKTKLDPRSQAMQLGKGVQASQHDILSPAMQPGTMPQATHFDTTSKANLVQVKTEQQRLASGTKIHSTIFVLQVHGHSPYHRKLHFIPIKKFLGLMAMSYAPVVHNGEKIGVLSNRLPSRASWEILYKVVTGYDIAPTPQDTMRTKRCVSPVPWQAPVAKATKPTELPQKEIPDIPDTKTKLFTQSVMKDSITQVLRPLPRKHKSTVKRKASPRITVHAISGSPLQKRAKPTDFTYTSIVVTNKDNVLLTRNKQNKFWFPGCHIRKGESRAKPQCERLVQKQLEITPDH